MFALSLEESHEKKKKPFSALGSILMNPWVISQIYMKVRESTEKGKEERRGGPFQHLLPHESKRHSKSI